MKKNLLQRMQVGFQCPMNWDKMDGNEQERFCNQCSKTVTDLTQMTVEEVAFFVAEHGPRATACIRLQRNQNGYLLVKGCGSRGAVVRETARKTMIGVTAASGLALASCSTPEKQPPAMMGVMCIAPED